MDENYEAASQEFTIAARLSPNESDISALLAAIQRRQGKWQEAIASYERVEKLDPQNANVVRNLVYTYSALAAMAGSKPRDASAGARWRRTR